jgi:predicted dinucleotide-binding enzyme
MTTISIIGSGNMATAIGTRAAKHGHTIEVMSRDTAKAQALADKIGNGATAGTFGATPLGDIVIVAVPYTNAVSVVGKYGDALAGKVIIDISNTFNADATGLVTPDGISGAQETAKAAPASAHVVKAATSWPRAARWTCSSPATTRTPRRACRRSSRASGCARWTRETWRWRTGWREWARC